MSSAIPSHEPQGPLPEDGETVNPTPSLSDTSFEFPLPVSAKSIYILSRGSSQVGQLNCVLDSQGDSTRILANVALEILPGAPNGHRICLLNRQDEWGIGLYTPRHVHSNQPVFRFTVTLQFPRTLTGSPLSINNLTTTVGDWGQSINLDNNVNFKTISLTSGLGPVTINGTSMSSSKITVGQGPVTINDTNLGSTQIQVGQGPVTGSFSGDQDIDITTSNGGIDIACSIVNTVQTQNSKLKLVTNNGPITAAINLVSEFAGSIFNVDSLTSNGALNLTFPSTPIKLPFPVLNLKGTTSNAAVDVKLNPTYEGSIQLTTTGFGNNPVLDADPNVQDPSAQGRTRVIKHDSIESVLNGTITWGKGPGPGNVELTTTNGKPILHL